MEKLDVRLAAPEDLPAIWNIYAYARDYMAKSGNAGQWGRDNPKPEIVYEDLDRGNLYVITERGRICGVFAFIIGNDATYERISGAWHASTVYGTIHRLAGDGTVGGIFSRCLSFCEERWGYLRVDTHEKNQIMRHLLNKNGFQPCGIIHVSDGSPRIAFDRIL